MEIHSPEAFRKHIRVYIAVFVALIVLTVVTVWVSTWHLIIPAASIVIALTIATVKGSLVGAFFMHLKSEKPLVLYCLLITFVFLITVILVPLLMLLNTIEGNAG